MALNVVSTDRLSTNVKTSNLATGLSSKVGESKNLVINGAMNVAQRGTTSTSNGMQTVDRFTCDWTGADEIGTQAQHALTSSDTGPWAAGFRNSFHITNGNQTSGAGATDRCEFFTKLEAQTVANSGWNYTSASSYITLSFWVKSSVAQTFKGYLYSYDGTPKSYPFETGSLSADTWTKITKKIPGHADLTFDNNNDQGWFMSIEAFLGTDYTSGVTEDAWMTYASGDRTADNTSTWWTTNNATFEITGVQLEVGDTATEFEHRSYGDELAKCQRYFQVVAKKGGAAYSMGCGMNQSGSLAHLVLPFYCTMRTTPSLDQLTGTNYYTLYSNGGQETFDSWNLDAAVTTPERAGLNKTGLSITQGSGNLCRYNNANAEIRFSAEL